MIGMFLRFLLTVVTFRILAGLLRLAGAGSAPGGPAPAPPKPIVDRSSAIDVPFTEDHPEG